MPPHSPRKPFSHKPTVSPRATVIPHEDPAACRVPFPCTIRSRSPVLHAVQPCCDALTPAALSCCLRLCAAIAVLFAAALVNSVVICTEPHSPLQMHWRIPGGVRSGKRAWCSPFTRPCRVRVRVARHSGQDARHTPGDGRNVTPKSAPEEPPSRACCSASPSRKPVCRRRVRREANTLLTCLPCPAQAGAPRIRVAPAVRAPGAPVFDYRRRAGLFSLRRLGFTGVALRAPR